MSHLPHPVAGLIASVPRLPDGATLPASSSVRTVPRPRPRVSPGVSPSPPSRKSVGERPSVRPCGRGAAAPAGVQQRTAPLLLFAHLIFRARAEGRGSGADATLCAAASAAGSWPTQRHTGPLGTRPSTGTGGDLRQEQEGNNLRFLPGLILS